MLLRIPEKCLKVDSRGILKSHTSYNFNQKYFGWNRPSKKFDFSKTTLKTKNYKFVRFLKSSEVRPDQYQVCDQTKTSQQNSSSGISLSHKFATIVTFNFKFGYFNVRSWMDLDTATLFQEFESCQDRCKENTASYGIKVFRKQSYRSWYERWE